MDNKVFLYYFECKDCSEKIKLPDNPSRLSDVFELECPNGHVFTYSKDDMRKMDLEAKFGPEERVQAIEEAKGLIKENKKIIEESGSSDNLKGKE